MRTYIAGSLKNALSIIFSPNAYPSTHVAVLKDIPRTTMLGGVDDVKRMNRILIDPRQTNFADFVQGQWVAELLLMINPVFTTLFFSPYYS